ncbi:MAG: hypothetical protein ACQKBY_02305 [Verrucomicrobiales bacterium]
MNAKKHTLSALLVAATSLAQGAIISVSDDFDDGIDTTWVATGGGSITHDMTSAYDAGATGGDFLSQDGGMKYDSQDTTPGNEWITLELIGALELGEEVVFSYGIYNDETSFVRVRAEIYDLDTGTTLAQSAVHLIKAAHDQGGVTDGPIDGSISYTATASDIGKSLAIRFVEDGNHPARDIQVDHFSLLSSIPEPQAMALALLGLAPLALRRR